MLPLIGGGTAVVIGDAGTGFSSSILASTDPGEGEFRELRAVPTWTRSSAVPLPIPRCSIWSWVERSFTVEFAREISRRLAIEKITNLYGPTEATIDTLDLRSKASRQVRMSRLAVRCRTTASMSWMIALSLYPLGSWGALHIRWGCWSRLCWSRRSDWGALCCGPVWRCGWSDVPQRGLGALARGWSIGVCWAVGPSGQGSWFSH